MRQSALGGLLIVTFCSAVGMAQANAPDVNAPARAEQQSATEGATGSQVVHILVGHSIVVRTEARLKRVLIGNPAVLSTTTTSPNELVVTASAPGSSSLVLWQANGQSRIIEVYGDLDASMLREAIGRAFPGEPIQVEAEEGKIILNGTASTPAVAEQVGKMAAPFSKDVVNSLHVLPPVRLKQVSLKIRFAEVDRAKLNELGLNIFSTGAANTIGTVSTGQFRSPTVSKVGEGSSVTNVFNISDALNIFVFRPDLNLGVTIRALEDKNVLQILAEPNVLAMSGEPARFLAGGEIPYPIVQPGVGGQNTVTVTFKPFGVKLDFTGTIESDNTIRLKIAPEVSAVDFSNAVTVEGTVLPAISTRRAETVVQLKDGQSFGIAGLLDTRTTAVLSKIPGIGDLPIIGYLFRSKSVNKTLTELIVIATPSIVDPVGTSTPTPELPKAPYRPLTPGKFDQDISDKPNSGSK